MEQKKGYSSTIVGLIVTLVGGYVGTQLSESCSTEVMAKLSPVIGMLPGVIVSWVGRWRKGDITPLGFRK
jgi:hypothetical protein